MAPISDQLLDQLQDEMREMARGLQSEARTLCEDDDTQANRELADYLNEIAANRPLLVRFAFLLRKHATRHAALAELTGAPVAA